MSIEQHAEKMTVDALARSLRDHSSVFGYWMVDIVIAGEPRMDEDKMDWLINKLEMMVTLTKALKWKMFGHKPLESEFDGYITDPEGD